MPCFELGAGPVCHGPRVCRTPAAVVGIVTEVCLDTPLMSTLPSQPHLGRRRPASRARSRSADVAAFVAGGLAAALGIAIGELIAGLVAGAPSLVIAIGDLVIANQPPGGKELFVELFGEADKLVLNVLIVVGAVLIAGLLGRRRAGAAGPSR